MKDLFSFQDNNDYSNMNEFEIMDMAMNNAYIFLIGGEDWSKMKDPIVWMPMDKGQADSKEEIVATEDDFDSHTTIDILIDYFISQEEYEKCAELVKLKKIRINRENEFKNLKDKI